MPILDLQRRLREAGRIRIGVQVANSNGKGKHPSKLSTFRLTSQDETVIKAAAGMFGGMPQRWADAPVGDQWEVITESNVIPVVIPPAAAAFSQWYEQWSGGGCVRRCDGQTEMLKDTPCVCANEDERQCKPTTRLNVILRDLPGLGAWRLESHGWYAATELAGTVEVCLNAATRGQLLPAVLRLEQRSVTRPGESVKKFAVPILDIQMTPTSLGLVVGSPAIGAGPVAQEGSWQPLPAAAPMGELGAGEVAAAIKDPGTDGPKKRKNSAPEIRSTGVKPRGRGVVPEPAPVVEGEGPVMEGAAMIAIAMNGHGVHDRASKLRACGQVLGHPVVTSKDLTIDEVSTVLSFLHGLGEGEPFPFEDDDAEPSNVGPEWPHGDHGPWTQTGRCVYCACGARLYQGTVPKDEAARAQMVEFFSGLPAAVEEATTRKARNEPDSSSKPDLPVKASEWKKLAIKHKVGFDVLGAKLVDLGGETLDSVPEDAGPALYAWITGGGS